MRFGRKAACGVVRWSRTAKTAFSWRPAELVPT